MSNFQHELKNLINKHSQENGSNTPDNILAYYLQNCLAVFDCAVNLREDWYGRPALSVKDRKAAEAEAHKQQTFKTGGSISVDQAKRMEKSESITAIITGLNKVANHIIEQWQSSTAQLKRDWEAEALKKRQFPVGGCIPDQVKKEAAREVMADIEKITSETLHGDKKTVEIVPSDLWEQFSQAQPLDGAGYYMADPGF